MATHPPVVMASSEKESCAYSKAGLLYRLTYSWISGLIKKANAPGAVEPLEENDANALVPSEYDARTLCGRFDATHSKHQALKVRTYSVSVL